MSLKIGNFHSNPFNIHNGTPQGSPLLPILSAFYTAPLLNLAKNWKYHNLMLYVDNGTIFAISATKQATIDSAIAGFCKVTQWLQSNGLEG